MLTRIVVRPYIVAVFDGPRLGDEKSTHGRGFVGPGTWSQAAHFTVRLVIPHRDDSLFFAIPNFKAVVTRCNIVDVIFLRLM